MSVFCENRGYIFNLNSMRIHGNSLWDCFQATIKKGSLFKAENADVRHPGECDHEYREFTAGSEEHNDCDQTWNMVT